jgi:membrane-associated PAP2 superfamily phosphatase
MTMTPARTPWLVAAVTLPALLAWDATGLDMAMASWFGGPTGFALKQHWLPSSVLHEGGRLVSWGLVLVLTGMVWWPVGAFTRIDASRRVQLVVSVFAAVLVVSALKASSSTSCPWDLAVFGRAARHVSHWDWQTPDGGSGHCFPAGHASAGFAFLGGYFAFAGQAPGVARGWLLGALIAGLAFGIAQQMRGAHFMSHTLWTAWLCWLVASLVDRVHAAIALRCPSTIVRRRA